MTVVEVQLVADGTVISHAHVPPERPARVELAIPAHWRTHRACVLRALHRDGARVDDPRPVRVAAGDSFVVTVGDERQPSRATCRCCP